MRFLFITECSPLIGTGHVMRSITLATAIRQLGHDVIFHGDGLCEWGKSALIEMSFQVSSGNLIAETAMCDLAIMDGYSFDSNLMRRVMKSTRLAVIEDFMHREIQCDILLDPNIGGEPSFFKGGDIEFGHYIGGSSFVTLTESVSEETPVSPNNKAKSLLISFGGSDPSFASENALKQLIASPLVFEKVALVVGPMIDKERRLGLEDQAAKLNVEVVGPLSSLAPLYREFRWAIGAGGTSAYERVFQMIPSLNLVTQSNQERLANKLSELGLAFTLDVRDGDFSGIIGALEAIMGPAMEQRLEEFQSGFRLGSGAANTAKELELHLNA